MFLDTVSIYVESGKGGDGMIHMHREKYKPRGGPDGGDGGHGGNVILQVNPLVNTLAKFHYNQRFIAESGKKGGPNNRSGKSAPDLIIPVPPGTVVYNASSDEILGDLVDQDQTLIVAKGGRGGRGNQHFATSRNQAPLTGEKGEPGEAFDLRLELKLIADIGLVGLPNAGKSSLLASVTNATPKIAAYPFTTLEPNLGVIVLDHDKSMVLADIPGLIEGAHMGAGLGFEFLRHIQRTRVIIHVIDGTSIDPVSDFSQINSEMALFDPKLAIKNQIIAFNKIDLPDAQANFEMLKTKFKKFKIEILPISAVTHKNVKELMWKAYDLLQNSPLPEPERSLPIYRAEEDPRSFSIQKDEEGWHVSGKAIERAAAMTFWEHPGSVRRFQKLMKYIGLEDSLRKAGIEEGEEVIIGEFVLEWQD